MAVIKVDFTGVEESSSIAAGRYSAKVISTKIEQGDKAPYILWELEIQTGAPKGLHINHITSLSPKALFALRDTLIAMGVKVPSGAANIDPDKFIGKSFGIEVFIKNVEGNEYSNIKKVFSLASVSASATPAPKAATPQAVALDVGEPPYDEGDVVLNLED